MPRHQLSPSTNTTIGYFPPDYMMGRTGSYALAAVERPERYARVPYPRSLAGSYLVTVEPYEPSILTETAWLGAVERRIQGPTVPKEYEREALDGTIREEVSQAALLFFRNFADLLPGEPYLYPSKDGDLVAEFEAPGGSLTTVLSPEATILFAVPRADEDRPRSITLRKGTNRFREVLRDFARLLSVTYGKVESSR